MSKQSIEFDAERLRNIAKSELRDPICSFRAEGVKLMELVAELNEMWQGPAKDVFVERFQREWESFDQIVELMLRGMDDLLETSQEYESCEDDISAMIQQI